MTVSKMTAAEIEQAKKQLGEIKAKLTINYSDKGVGVDCTETGVSPVQVIQGILALCSLINADQCNSAIQHLDEFPKVMTLLKATAQALSDCQNKGKEDDKNKD